MTHKHADIEDTLYFYFASNDTSGSGDDGASALADVRLSGAAASAIPVLSPTPALLAHANYPPGCYEVAVAATTGNGFAAGSSYAVFCTLTVDSQNPSGFIGSFVLEPILANIVEISDDATAASNLELDYDGTGYDKANSTMGTVDTLTGHTAQTGDNYARLGAPDGVSVSADIADLPTVAEFEARTLVAASYFDPAADTVATVTDVTNQVTADVTAISGDSVSADNLELQYDETGLTGDTFPATQAAVANIGAASGGAINFAATEDNTGGAIDPSSAAFVGSVQSGTFASTEAEDGVPHDIDDTGDDIDIVYGFPVGGGRAATQVSVVVSVSGNNDQMAIRVYDHVGDDWETIKFVNGSPGLSYQAFDIPLLSKHTGAGGEIGKVYIRFDTLSTTPSNLSVDQCLVAAVSSNRTVGYSNGSIWVDSAGTAGSEDYVNGVADNPCPWANALVIAASLDIFRFQIANGNTVTLDANSDNYTLLGVGWALALGGQSIEGAAFSGASITGIGTATVTRPSFENCLFGAATIPPALIKISGVGAASGTFTASSAGQYLFDRCFSMVPGSGSPTLDFSGLGAATGINNRGWKGGATYTLDADCTLSHEVLSGGGTTITTGGGDVEVRGITRSLTVTMSAAETVQFNGITGPVILSGTTSATVNLYGVSAGPPTDTTSGPGATVTDETVSRGNIIGGTYALDTDANGRVRVVDGTGAGELDTDSGTVALRAATQASIDAIEADTNELQTDWADAGRLDTILDARADQTTVDNIETDTQDIQSRLPAALVTGRMSSDAVAISGDTTAADNLEASASTMLTGTAQTGTLTTTQMTTDITETNADQFIGRIIVWTSGTLIRQKVNITDYTVANGELTFSPATDAPSNGDEFIIV